VGLVTGACFAEQGHDVIVVDVARDKVDAVNAARPPFYEPGLDELLARTVGRSLRATTDLRAAVAESDITLIAVGTPLRDGAIDLGAVLAVSREVGSSLSTLGRYHVVVIRSTVVPGATGGPIRAALEQGSGKRAGPDFGLAMNPEFLTEGTALQDFRSQDRIVIGAIDERSRTVVEALYEGIAGVPRVSVNLSSAELIKYASNALLATAISFSNELANLASAVGGIDIVEVMRGVHLSRYLTSREGTNGSWTAPLAGFLEAGCGYGGSCLPKDVKALVAHGASLGTPLPLLEAVDRVNAGRADVMLGILRRHLPALRGAKVTVLGLAFKPDTDDVRETPAGPVIRSLLDGHAEVTVYDPVASGAADALFGPGRVRVAPSLAAAVADAEAVLLVTRWPEFVAVPELIAAREHPPLVVDGRRVLDRGRIARYDGIGL
jgi:UDPglucose 6-dehydrogenase/GDP-mannose 6-dehydrogenase